MKWQSQISEVMMMNNLWFNNYKLSFIWAGLIIIWLSFNMIIFVVFALLLAFV